jgi:hypothetical protein
MAHPGKNKHEGKTMWSKTMRVRGLFWGGLVFAVLLTSRTPTLADPAVADDEPVCTVGQERKIRRGFQIAPVPLDLTDKARALVGLGSYIVNAQGGCNDCHTNPSYAAGGNPFQGEPERINAAGYLAGGVAFGPFLSRNLTPCQDGKPAGLSLHQFIQAMRTGVDFKDDLLPPGDTPILQVMPWPVYGHMTRCDLRAIYAYLQAIPPHDDEGCTPGGP